MLLKDSAYFPVYVEIPDFVREQVSEEEAKSPEIRNQVREMMVEMYPPKKGVGLLNVIYDSVDLISFMSIIGKAVVVSRCYHWTGKLAI
jgi:hypothetical protein